MTSLNLLDHPPIRRAIGDPAAHGFLKEVLALAASRDPVDVLGDLEFARNFVDSYLSTLVAPRSIQNLSGTKPSIY
jgi:hypothetical protein